MRIAHFSPLDGTRGGISTVVSNYRGSELAREFEMTFVQTHADGSRAKKLAVAGRALLQAVGLAVRRPPDMIHVHVGDFPSLYRKAAVIVPLLMRRTKSILHFHGANFLAEYAELPPGRRRFVQWFLRQFDVVLCLSESWRRDLSTEFGLSEAVVLPNAVSIPGLQAQGRASPDVPLELLFMGLIGERKGVFDLLDAMETACRRGVEIRLAIGGNGDVERLKARLSASPALAARVRYLGWIEGEERERAFLSAHAYVLPSRAEGMPMSVLEAMSYGLPIVSCPVGGIPELVDDRSAILVQPGDKERLADAICQLATDETSRQARAQAAADRVRTHFDLHGHNARLASVYRALHSR
jgi:glycosyltransferase involved in cell wall biosynthesis